MLAAGWDVVGNMGNFNMKKSFALSMTLLLTIATFSCSHNQASTSNDKAAGFFEKLDDNGDKSISLKELHKHHRKFFKSLDHDGSGSITQKEASKSGKTEEFKQVESKKDNDQVISYNESFKIEQDRFLKADKNKDNSVSWDEFEDHVRSVSN